MEKLNKVVDNLGYNKTINRNLEKEYLNSLKNEEFKQLVDKLNIPKEILMKYTSLLEESSIEYNHCLHCKNIMECQNKIEGYAYLPKINNNNLEFNYKACRYKERILKNNKYLDNVSYYNTSEELKQAQMKKIYADDPKRLETIKWLKEFIDNYPSVKKGLYLYGNFGCGKSYLISALFNELGKNKIKSAVIFWPEYLRDLKGSFGIDFNSKFEYIKRVPLLLIDDIGAENLTSWGRDEILCPILQTRMDANLPTFFTSNLDLKALEQHLASTNSGVEVVKARRIIERIKQLTDQIEMISINLRK